MSIEGPIPIQTGNLKTSMTNSIPNVKVPKTDNRFKALLDKFRNCESSSAFSIRACNIVDPINASNNLGISVARNKISLIDLALTKGLNHLNVCIEEYSSHSASKISSSARGYCFDLFNNINFNF